MKADYANFVQEIQSITAIERTIYTNDKKAEIEKINKNLTTLTGHIVALDAKIDNLCDKRKMLENQRHAILRSIDWIEEKRSCQ